MQAANSSVKPTAQPTSGVANVDYTVGGVNSYQVNAQPWTLTWKGTPQTPYIIVIDTDQIFINFTLVRGYMGPATYNNPADMQALFWAAGSGGWTTNPTMTNYSYVVAPDYSAFLTFTLPASGIFQEELTLTVSFQPNS